jgi:hypothetical protein
MIKHAYSKYIKYKLQPLKENKGMEMVSINSFKQTHMFFGRDYQQVS